MALRNAAPRVVVALPDLLTSATVERFRREGVAEPAGCGQRTTTSRSATGGTTRNWTARSGASTRALTEGTRSATSSPGSSGRSVMRCQAC